MIIESHFKHLQERCKERGWTLEEVMPCVVSKNGDIWLIDVSHPNYPKYHKTGKVGTELKLLLSKIGINSTPNCACNARASYMDQQGVKWCEENIDTIIEWLRQEATKRKLPFVRTAAKLLIYKAIKNAKIKNKIDTKE